MSEPRCELSDLEPVMCAHCQGHEDLPWAEVNSLQGRRDLYEVMALRKTVPHTELHVDGHSAERAAFGYHGDSDPDGYGDEFDDELEP